MIKKSTLMWIALTALVLFSFDHMMRVDKENLCRQGAMIKGC